MTEKSIKRSDLILSPTETDYLIGKWRLTDTLYILPDNDLLPCDCDHRRLISLEFLPGNRFVEVSRDRRQQIVTHAGTYREAGEDILLYKESCGGHTGIFSPPARHGRPTHNTLIISTLIHHGIFQQYACKAFPDNIFWIE